AKAAAKAEGPVLIAWEHQLIPDIVNAIVGNNTTCPQKWPRPAIRPRLDSRPRHAGGGMELRASAANAARRRQRGVGSLRGKIIRGATRSDAPLIRDRNVSMGDAI